MSHAPVMLEEALAALAPADGEVYLDATFGGGGYARAILAAADCRLYAIDRDPAAIARAQALESVNPGRLIPIEARFGDLDAAVDEQLDGVVLDIGVSSFQLDEADRGFSFRFDAPLDMRMGASGPTAADALALLPEAALADVFFHLGEEPGARRIARAIEARRQTQPVRATADFADLCARALAGRGTSRIHPATRAFQALRMLVNDELGELARALAAAEARLKPGGRLVVVAFHSLEDRIVKAFLAERSGQTAGGSRHAPAVARARAPSFTALARQRAPAEAEIAANPRARSARLRSAVRSEAPAWGAFAHDPLPTASRRAWEAIAP